MFRTPSATVLFAAITFASIASKSSGQTYPWPQRTPKIRYNGNECSTGETQSPIILQDDQPCADRHKMRFAKLGKCGWDEMEFMTTDRGLRADFNNCNIQPVADYSNSPANYTLATMKVIVPSEHKVKTPQGTKRYQGELVLSHYGGKSEEGDLTDHILNIAIFLETGSIQNEKYERYLKRWERNQEIKYHNCGKNWTRALCSRGLHEDGSDDGARRALRGHNENELQLDTDLFYEHEEDTSETVRKRDPYQHIGSNSTHRELREKREQSKPYMDFIPGEHYWKYTGSMTVKPCYQKVNWRVHHDSLKISYEQLQRTHDLIAGHLNKCDLATTCRHHSKCRVSCNRPAREPTQKHGLRNCHKWYPDAPRIP